MENQPIVVEQIYPVSPETVWKAITDKDEMKIWYFDLPEFRPETGLEFQFWGGPAEDRQYLHLCKITEAIPAEKLSYSWRYEGFDGDTLVSFGLFPEDNQTRLRLTHSGLESFPSDNPDFARENFVVGWNWIIGTSLKEYIEKSKP
ncbi:MAG: SRPBCC domain-containing protein [Prolixibacteraceae bacterium]